MLQYAREQVTEQVTALRVLLRRPKLLAFSILNLAMIVFSALMLWKGLIYLSRSESPVVVVLSGSMEPAFSRGDILLLNNRAANLTVGDIVVFKIAGRDVPIVHRVLRTHMRVDGDMDVLTKGDANQVDDRNLYAQGQLWLKRSDIVGKAEAYVPYVGFVTILLNDYPALKYVLISVMALFVLTGKDQG